MKTHTSPSSASGPKGIDVNAIKLAIPPMPEAFREKWERYRAIRGAEERTAAFQGMAYEKQVQRLVAMKLEILGEEVR